MAHSRTRTYQDQGRTTKRAADDAVIRGPSARPATGTNLGVTNASPNSHLSNWPQDVSADVHPSSEHQKRHGLRVPQVFPTVALLPSPNFNAINLNTEIDALILDMRAEIGRTSLHQAFVMPSTSKKSKDWQWLRRLTVSICIIRVSLIILSATLLFHVWNSIRNQAALRDLGSIAGSFRKPRTIVLVLLQKYLIFVGHAALRSSSQESPSVQCDFRNPFVCNLLWNRRLPSVATRRDAWARMRDRLHASHAYLLCSPRDSVG